MIVNRRTFRIKPEHYADAVALAKATAQVYPAPHGVRIYSPLVGPFHTMVSEAGFESLAQYERLDAEFWATPEAAASLDKWRVYFSGGGTNEIWELVE